MTSLKLVSSNFEDAAVDVSAIACVRVDAGVVHVCDVGDVGLESVFLQTATHKSDKEIIVSVVTNMMIYLLFDYESNHMDRTAFIRKPSSLSYIYIIYLILMWDN